VVRICKITLNNLGVTGSKANVNLKSAPNKNFSANNVRYRNTGSNICLLYLFAGTSRVRCTVWGYRI